MLFANKVSVALRLNDQLLPIGEEGYAVDTAISGIAAIAPDLDACLA